MNTNRLIGKAQSCTILGLLVTTISSNPLLADTVVNGEKEWRQVSDTIGFHWSAIATVCNNVTGECSGSLGGVDYSGWTWASGEEVGELFKAITPHPGGIYNLTVFDAVVQPWIDDWFALFSPTFDGFISYQDTYTLGYTRDGYAPHVQKAFRGSWENYAWTDFTYLAGYAYGGAWLHTSATPEPTAFACVGFEPPMANYPVKAKKNRVFPLKIELFDDDLFEQTDAQLIAAPVVQVIYDPSTLNEDVTEDAFPAGNGTEGNQFEFTDDGIWQFNMKSKNYTAKGTYLIEVMSGDVSEYVIEPSCVTSFVIN